MDLEFTQDQKALSDTLTQIVSRHMEQPREGATIRPASYYCGNKLEHELELGEFLSVALTEGCGALEAAILVYEVGRSPLIVETSNSVLVAPLLTGTLLPRPVAVARREDLCRAVRYLDRAKTLLVDLDDDVAVLPTADISIAAVPSMFGYPLGRLTQMPDFNRARKLGSSAVANLRDLWRIGLALEAAAAMQAAIDFTVGYVTERRVFGRPVGTYQAVQHRLAADVQKARGAYWLAMKAAWSGVAADAAIAALYAQNAIRGVVYDCHQFNGALGMTLEHKLHFWTFRLRLLEGELGGARAQAGSLADMTWGRGS
jgi:hypothetical protein